MPAADERGEDELDLVALAVDDRLDVGDEAIGDLARPLEALGLTPALREGRLHGLDAIHGVSRVGVAIAARCFPIKHLDGSTHFERGC